MSADLFNNIACSSETLRDSILRHIRYTLARPWGSPTPRELFKPLSLAIRDHLIEGWLKTEQRYRERDAKRLYYLSLEFLMGRWLSDNLCNLRLEEESRAVLADLNSHSETSLEFAPDPRLANSDLT